MPTMADRQDEFSQRFGADYHTHDSKAQRWNNARMIATSKSGTIVMMQVFDRLSLFFCANFDLTTVPATGAHTAGKGYYGPSIKPTPLGPGQEETELKLRVIDQKTVVVEPYPFDQSPFEVSVRGKLIPRIAYPSQESFREVYGKAQRQLFEFRLLAS
jgi:hypothetical protein